MLLFLQKKKILFFFVLLCAATPRDPYLWPFSPASPWNTPIGAGARFAADDDPATRDLLAGHALIHAGAWGMAIFLARSDDPWRRVHDEENGRDFTVRIPPGARPDPMQDAHLFVVEPGHPFALEMYRARPVSYGWIARRAFRVSLTGPGMFLRDGKFPGVRAMDASGMGGVLREQEVRGGPIRHALTFLLPPARLRHGPVWPSAREDFWGFRYYAGNVPIGTLVAIPGGVDVGRLGMTEAGMRLARALQDYGAYCDDSAGSDGIVLTAENAAERLPALQDMRRDWPLIRRYLRIVVNNVPGSPGGGGVARAARAPEFAPAWAGSAPSTP